MENKDKIILDLCGGTGAWSKPYKEAGYDVRVITLPDFNVITYPFCALKNIYGVLAAPPCTMFSFARTRAKTPRDLRKGMEVVYACLRIIWECRYRTKLHFWALENPMGYLRQFLGKPTFTFDPCDFGDPYTKKTDLWGYFNHPKLNPVKLTPKQKWDSKQNNLSKYPRYSDITRSKQSEIRAITPPGFAKAFFEANR